MKSSSSSSKQVGNTKQPAKQVSCAKNWCFTLNNYSEKDIESLCSSSSIKSYIFQEETGENGTPHLQGFVEFKNKLRPKTLFSSRIHWEKTKNVEASIAYCSKEETRTGKVYSNILTKREDKRLVNFEMRPWQKDLYEYLMGEPNDRTIVWVVDKEGGKGKSLFSKWLAWKHNDVLAVTMNKSADILTVVEEHYKTYLLDLPRSYDVQYCPFNALEQIKNGFVTEGKLKKTARQLSFAPPHVVVFSNDDPNMMKISLDRWKIIRL